MKLPRNWKAVLALLLMFIAGGITGSVLTAVGFKHAFERILTARNWTDRSMQIMQKDLSLTPQQQPEVRAILEDTWRQIGGHFGQAVDESGRNLVASWRRIDQELTPEQRVEFQQECQLFRERLQQTLKIELPPK
jgi:Spy/CpxP family protein refolding chaperone